MISREDNERLCRVEGDAPMGRLMRDNYWIPFAVSAQIRVGDDPRSVRLLGGNYVAFRAEDGRIGFFGEHCPHRRASLLLGHVEGNGIRCIFHGWKMDVSGRVTEVPTQLVKPEEFAARIRTEHFPVREAGGLAWVWLGKSESPAFPELPFVGAHESNTWLSASLVPCNWLQGVEAALDSAHVGVLHKSWVERMGDLKKTPNIRMSLDAPPRYETRRTPYGLSAAALRQRQDGSVYARITEYCMPFVTLVPADRPAPNEGYLFIIAPVDDANHLLFWGYYSERRRKPPQQIGLATPEFVPDPTNLVRSRGGRERRWGQDRALVRAGHFTGFADTLIEEDVVVQVSMGPIVDRTAENISSSDVAIVQLRKMLLQSLDDARGGALPPASGRSDVVRVPNPLDVVLEPGAQWDFHQGREAA